jgi:uncharacterized protein (DUF1015 family)
MYNIYPFRAIVPGAKSPYEYEIKNNFLHLKQDIVNNNFKRDCGIKHILSMVQKNYLVQQKRKGFYCCNITAPGISTTGLLALIKVNNIGKIIFEHERCVDYKRDQYIQYFKKHKLQTSPIILIHKDMEQINLVLNNIISKQESFFSITDQEYKYDLWELEDILEYQKLYNNVVKFLIADGHHRIASLSKIDINAYVLVFLVPESNIKSANILREYFNTSDEIKTRLLSSLNKNFSIKKLNCMETINISDKIYIKIDDTIYIVEESEIFLSKLQVLELLNNEINYFNRKLNFYNMDYKSSKDKLINNNKQIVAFIPAYVLKDDINFIYPPHSTLFYPKLPEGFVSFLQG